MKLYQKPVINSAFSDGSRMPFGKYSRLGYKLVDVPLAYWRWFYNDAPDDLRADWPGLVEYAREILANENAAKVGRALRCAPSGGQGTDRPTKPKSNPAAAWSAFEEFKRMKETLK